MGVRHYLARGRILIVDVAGSEHNNIDTGITGIAHRFTDMVGEQYITRPHRSKLFRRTRIRPGKLKLRRIALTIVHQLVCRHVSRRYVGVDLVPGTDGIGRLRRNFSHNRRIITDSPQ